MPFPAPPSDENFSGPGIPGELRGPLGRLQDSLRAVIAALGALPFWGGKLVSVRMAAATRKVIHHGIGTECRAFIVSLNYDATMNSATFSLHADQATGMDPKVQLALIASAACDVDLWIYPKASRAISTVTGQSA